MPLYMFECEKCKKRQEVINSFADSQKPPEETASESCPEHTWKKIITGTPTFVRGPNWGSGSKGNW